MAVDINTMKARIADLLHLANGVADLKNFVTGSAQLALDKAVLDIQGILGERGFSLAQLNTWTGYDSAVIFQAISRYLQLEILMDQPENQRALKAIVEGLADTAGLKTAALFDVNGVQLFPSGNIGFGPSVIRAPGTNSPGDPGEPFRDSNTGTWRPI